MRDERFPGYGTMPRLRSDLRVHVTADGAGFVETAQAVRRLRGTKLAVLAERVLPLLDGSATVEEISRSLPPSVAPTELLALLDHLHARGLLADDPPRTRRRTGNVAVVGCDPLAAPMVAALREVVVRGRVARVPGEPDADALAAVLRTGAPSLLVVVTPALVDPWPAAVNDLCVDRGQPCLFVGMDDAAHAFVGPLWTPRRFGPCLECLRLRLHSNSTSGETRLAYQRHLRAAGASAVRHHPPGPAAAHLAGWLSWWADRWLSDHVHTIDHPDHPDHSGHPEPPDSVAPTAPTDPAGAPDASRHPGTRTPTQPTQPTQRYQPSRCDTPRDRRPRPANLLRLHCADLSTTWHHVLAVPTCPACEPHQRRAQHLVHTAADPQTAVDSQVGIVHAVTVRRAENGPPVHLATTTSADLRRFRPALRVTNNGGAGHTAADARRAGLGESLERYAAGLHRREDLVLASWNTIRADALHPGALGFFSDAQYAQPGFPFVRFDGDTPVRWTRAVRWHDRAEVWVPASQVYLPYRRIPGEAFVAPAISTGLAAGPTFEAAVLNGLYEVLERDALAISWLHRLAPRPVPVSALHAATRVRAHLAATGRSWDVRFYDVSLDFSPAVVVAVMDHGDGGERAMSFGSACRLLTAHAVDKAFLEAAQGVGYVRALLRQYHDWTATADFDNVEDFHRHAILYTKYPALRAEVGYLLDPATMHAERRPARPDPPTFGRPAGASTAWCLALLSDQLHAAGHQVLVVDLTTHDVRSLGVSVVRVLVPGLQHLAGSHRFRFLGNPRLHEVVGRLGHGSAPDNPYPHPLP